MSIIKNSKRKIGCSIVVSFIIIMMIGTCLNASSSKGSWPFSLYYTGTPYGNNETESFTLPAASTYYVKASSYGGSFSSLAVYVNGVKIGNFTYLVMSGSGGPISYNPLYGNPNIQLTMNHGSGSASITGQIDY